MKGTCDSGRKVLILESTIDEIRKGKAEMALGKQQIDGGLKTLKNALSRRKK